MERAATKAIPKCKLCDKSKPWWTPELSDAYSKLREVCSILHSWMKDFHTTSTVLAENVKEKCKLTLRLVRKAKNDYCRKKQTPTTSGHTISGPTA